MVDNLTVEQRSRTMARVKGKGTSPEMKVRRLAHSMGCRYRLHRRDLPGNPDLVFARLRKIIFVHGCFWHGHEGCKAAKKPASNTGYWLPKLERNKARDKDSLERLTEAGWQVLVIWECQTRDHDRLRLILSDFLGR